jgi:uncharacterized protein (DUF885 family)
MPDHRPQFSTLQPPQSMTSPSAPSPTALARLIADERDFIWREDPLTATAEGVRSYDDRLPDVTPDAQARRHAADGDFLRRLHDIDRASLSGQEQVSYDLFES